MVEVQDANLETRNGRSRASEGNVDYFAERATGKKSGQDVVAVATVTLPPSV